MNKKICFEIGLKLFSVYYLVLFINAIPYGFFSFAVSSPPNIRNESLFIFLNFLLPCTYLFAGIVLAKYTSRITELLLPDKLDDKQLVGDSESADKILSSGIILIGVFYLIGSVSKIIGKGITFSVTDMGVFFWSELFSQGIIMVFSVILIFRNNSLISYIKTKSDKYI